jgi:hypothetical protein
VILTNALTTFLKLHILKLLFFKSQTQTNRRDGMRNPLLKKEQVTKSTSIPEKNKHIF